MRFGDKVKTGLDETRMLILGAQILLGFGFNSAFQDGFEDLPSLSRTLDALALLLILLTVGLLIAPGTYHRIVEAGRDSGPLLLFVSQMADWALLPFALGLGAVTCVAAERVFGAEGGIISGMSILGLALLTWFGVEFQRRLHSGHRERAILVHQKTMIEETPLDQRIVQMLTEARVIIPGAQALLGFQLTITITRSFGNLPMSSQIVHAASLGCIALAAILLMAPAAYHRIVFAGEDAEEMHRVGSLFITTATVPLIFGMAGDIYVVIAKISGSALGLTAGTGTFVVLVGLWHILPLAVRRHRRAKEHCPDLTV